MGDLTPGRRKGRGMGQPQTHFYSLEIGLPARGLCRVLGIHTGTVDSVKYRPLSRESLKCAVRHSF
jgi:hypothetical protein